MNIEEIQKRLDKFAKDRDWDQFHSPKNLSMALLVEVAELSKKILRDWAAKNMLMQNKSVPVK